MSFHTLRSPQSQPRPTRKTIAAGHIPINCNRAHEREQRRGRNPYHPRHRCGCFHRRIADAECSQHCEQRDDADDQARKNLRAQPAHHSRRHDVEAIGEPVGDGAARRAPPPLRQRRFGASATSTHAQRFQLTFSLPRRSRRVAPATRRAPRRCLTPGPRFRCKSSTSGLAST